VICGFSVAACGLALMLKSTLGMGPWGALEVGLSYTTGLSVGQITQLISLSLVFVSWGLGIKPSLVTLMNMFFIGWFLDRYIELIPVAPSLTASVLSYASGILVYCFGISFYLSVATNSSGPRESLMLGVSKKTHMSIRISKILIDSFALILAFIFKGPIGIGTILFACSAGPLIHYFLKVLKYSS
jgi:uncharacterized membrane protein YczE